MKEDKIDPTCKPVHKRNWKECEDDEDYEDNDSPKNISNPGYMRRFVNVAQGGLAFPSIIGHLQETMNKEGKSTNIREDYSVKILDEVLEYSWFDHLSKAYREVIHSKGIDAIPHNFPRLENLAKMLYKDALKVADMDPTCKPVHKRNWKYSQGDDACLSDERHVHQDCSLKMIHDVSNHHTAFSDRKGLIADGEGCISTRALVYLLYTLCVT